MIFLEPHIMLFLAFIALSIGFLKTGLPSMGGLLAVLMALVFPPKDAIGITLFYLLAGDSMAASFYWRQANIRELLKLLPMIVIGMLIATLIISQVDNTVLGLLIGLMIIFFVCLEPFRERVSAWAMRHIFWVRGLSGCLAGLTTTVGNAAGPVISLYLLLLRLDKHSFAGTAALFFLVVNLLKLPLYSAVGVFKDYYLFSVILTLPLVFVGGFLGRRFLKWIPQALFTQAVLVGTGIAGALLVIKYFIDL